MDEMTRQILEEMASGRIPEAIPDTVEDAETLRRLAHYLAAIQHVTLSLSQGDLSPSLQGLTGPVAGGLKALQAGLRHLTWQAKQIALGDLSQRVEFMGDFSTAFNAMVEDLGQTSSALTQMNQHLKDEMAKLRQLTEALRESEERFRLIAENVRVVIWTFDVNLQRFTYISPFITELRGLTVQEAMAEPLEHVFTPESLAFMRKKLTGKGKKLLSREAGFAKNSPDVIEIEQICRDGRIISVEVVISAITDPGGNIIEYVGVSRDITGRKRAEEERAACAWQQEGINLLQRSLLKPAPLEVKLADITQGIVRYFNADFCRIWLIRPGDLCEQGCMHATAMEGPHVCRQRERCLHLLASSGRYTHLDGAVHRRVPFACYKIGQIASGEAHKFLTNDVENDPRIHDPAWARELGLVSFAGYQLRVPEGEIIGVLALFSKHPILSTEDAMLDGLGSAVAIAVQQAAAEKALHEKTIFLDTLLDSLPLPVFYKDNNCRYLGFNRTYEEFIGKTRDQLLGKSVYDIAPRELAEVYHAKDLELLRDQGTQVYEARVRDLSGHMHEVVFHKAVFLDSDGRPLGLIGAITDITERKRAEEAQRESWQLLTDIFDFLPDATFVLDNDKKVIAWNRAIEEMTGISKAAMLGQGDYAYSVPFYGDRRPLLLDLLDLDNQELEANYRFVKRNNNRLQAEVSTPALYGGKGAWVWAFAAPLCNIKGERIGAIETVRDITVQKEAQRALRESRQRLMDIIEFLPDATFIIDNKGMVIAWNWAMVTLTGIQAQDMLGKGNYEYAIPFYGERRPLLIDMALRPDPEQEQLYVHFRRDGDTLMGEVSVPSLRASKAYIAATASVLRDSEGKVVAAIACLRDETQRKKMEDALRASQNQLALAMELARLVKWEFDVATNMFTFDEQFYTLYGTSVEQEGGCLMPAEVYVREFVHPEDIPLVARMIEGTITPSEIANSVELEHRIVRRDGEIRDIAVKFIAMRDHNGSIIKTYGANQDITEHKRLERMLHLQARTDQMTGINNRGYFLELLDGEIERARRYGRSLCVLMLDLDHFKSVNDTRGHAAGDEAIRTVIRGIQSTGLRQSDFIGRIGGEEFVVALPETDLQEAAEAAERVRSLVAATPVRYAAEHFSITVSIGVCEYRDGDSQESLLQRVDQAMYRAKQAGRNRVCLAS